MFVCAHSILYGILSLNAYVQGGGERIKVDIDSVLNMRATFLICWLMGWRVGGLGWVSLYSRGWPRTWSHVSASSSRDLELQE